MGYMHRHGSVEQPKASKPEVPGSTTGSSRFSLVFIKNLKTINLTRQMFTIYIVLSGAPHSYL